MNGAMHLLFRAAALALGVFLTYCETSGTYEYLMKDQGSFNYIVKAGCGVTIGTALLPVFAGMAWRAGKRARAASLWLIFPLAVGVVFFAAIDRTGGTADLAQQQRTKDARARALAERTETEATATLTTATEAASTECNSGPPEKRRGAKCLEAESKRDAAQRRVDAARAALLTAPVKETDPLAERIAAYTGDRITEEQVRLYRPLFLPLVLSILAGVFLSLGAHMDMPPAAGGTSAPNGLRKLPLPRWWLRRGTARPALPVRGDVPAGPAAPDREAPATGPAGVTYSAPPQPIVVDQPKAGNVPDIMADLLKPAKGRRVEIGSVFKAYAARCDASGVRGLVPAEFIGPAQRFCGECGIRTRISGERIYLLDVRLELAQCADKSAELAS